MIKKIADRFFPGFAAWYRLRRYQRLFAAQRMRPTGLGFDFIGALFCEHYVFDDFGDCQPNSISFTAAC